MFRVRRFILAVAAMVVWLSSAAQSTDTPANCMHSFEQFAYIGPRDAGEPLQLPGDPWQEVTAFEELASGHVLSDVALTRTRGSAIEIWIRASDPQRETVWVIYDSHAERPRIVPATISGRELVVYRVHVDANGTIWGAVRPGHEDIGTYPAFARFDDDLQRFVLVENMLRVASSPRRPVEYQFDGQGLIWILTRDAIYSYNMVAARVEHAVELTVLGVSGLTVAPDRSLIYLTTQSHEPHAGEKSTQYQIQLNQLDYRSGHPERIDLPQDWPVPRGALFDEYGRFWWGIFGYRSNDGLWQLTHPDLREYEEMPFWYSSLWIPELTYISSDGRLWYSNWTDASIQYHGSAWYDPESGTGCMFTNYATSIVEDSEGILWLVVDGQVYTAHVDDR